MSSTAGPLGGRVDRPSGSASPRPELRPAPRGRLGRRLRSPGLVVPAVSGAIAMLITAAGSWIPSLWGDEAASAMSAQRSLPSFLTEVTHVDAVHAVYYALLHVWIIVFGASTFALRFPSAIATGVTVAGVVVLMRMFHPGWRLPLTAGALAVMLPRLDYAGIEARGYAWTAALATWIVIVGLATLRGRIAPRVGWPALALLLGFGTALNLYLGSLIVVIGCLAATTSGGRRQLRGWIGASAGALALASPVIVFGAIEHQQVAFLAHRPMPADTWLVSQWFGYRPLAVVGWVLVLGAVCAMALRRDRDRDLGLGLALVLWAGIPTAFLVGTISSLHNYTPRYLTFTAPAVAMLMALGVEAAYRSWRPAGITILAGTLAASVPQFAYQRTPYAENNSDWAEVGAVIKANQQPGDQLAFDEVVRPSRRPVSAYRLYPGDFTGMTVPQLTVPYWQSTSWHDRMMTIAEAARENRFTAGTVFAVEADYPGEGVLDVTGIRSLEAAGYRNVEHWHLHSDIVFEFDRPGVDRTAQSGVVTPPQPAPRLPSPGA